MELKYTILGDIPSKKNSKRMLRNPKTGKMFPAGSKNYLNWKRTAGNYITHSRFALIERAEVTLTVFPKTRRAADLTNKAESVMDLLVDTAVIKDDNWFIVGDVRLKFGGVDKVNPRCEVLVKVL